MSFREGFLRLAAWLDVPGLYKPAGASRFDDMPNYRRRAGRLRFVEKDSRVSSYRRQVRVHKNRVPDSKFREHGVVRNDDAVGARDVR